MGRSIAESLAQSLIKLPMLRAQLAQEAQDRQASAQDRAQNLQLRRDEMAQNQSQFTARQTGEQGRFDAEQKRLAGEAATNAKIKQENQSRLTTAGQAKRIEDYLNNNSKIRIAQQNADTAAARVKATANKPAPVGRTPAAPKPVVDPYTLSDADKKRLLMTGSTPENIEAIQRNMDKYRLQSQPQTNTPPASKPGILSTWFGKQKSAAPSTMAPGPLTIDQDFVSKLPPALIPTPSPQLLNFGISGTGAAPGAAPAMPAAQSQNAMLFPKVKGEPLTPQGAALFLKLAGGDKNKARQYIMQQGFTIPP